MMQSKMDLHLTVEKGCEENVTLFLSQHPADVNVADVDGKTALFIACLKGFLKIVEQLLENGACASINAEDKNGRTALYAACNGGFTNIVELLLKNGAHVNSSHRKPRSWWNYTTPLHSAVKNGNEDIVNLLLNSHAIVDAIDGNGETSLHVACQNGFPNIAEQLLDSGASVNYFDGSGNTPLHLAVEDGTEETVSLLLRRHADVYTIDNYGKTPLHIACGKALPKIAKLLLDNGACVRSTCTNLTCYQWTPLHYGVFKGCEETVKLLLSKHPNVDAVNGDGMTALHIACQEGFPRVAELLLENGAYVNFVRKPSIYGLCNGYFTPLDFAICKGNEHTVKLLLNNHVNVDAAGEYSSKAVDLALTKRQFTNVVCLLKAGARVSWRTWTRELFSILHTAIILEQTEDVEILLEATEDLDTKNEEGETPFDFTMRFYAHKYNVVEPIIEVFYAHKYNVVEPIIEVFVKHFVKRKAENLFVSDNALQSLHYDDAITDFSEGCEEEIKQMRETTVICGSSINFFDILTKGENQLAVYMRNENIVKALDAGDYKTEFAIFGNQIEKQFSKGKIRKYLLQKSTELLYSAINDSFKIAYICVEKFTSYLPTNDLRNVLKAKDIISNYFANISTKPVVEKRHGQEDSEFELKKRKI